MAGKITGRHKNIDRGRQAYAFGAGTQKLYDYLDNNPECASVPVDYTNDVHVIAGIDNFISINNAVDIDLYGQVNAESAGTKQISGTGGQLDFVMGAYLSKGGKSFICLPSTFKQKDGTHRSPYPSDARERLDRHRYPSVRPLCRHRVRQGKPQGSVCLAACGSAHLGRAPGFPRTADPGRGKDAYLEAFQQEIKCCQRNYSSARCLLLFIRKRSVKTERFFLCDY